MILCLVMVSFTLAGCDTADKGKDENTGTAVTTNGNSKNTDSATLPNGTDKTGEENTDETPKPATPQEVYGKFRKQIKKAMENCTVSVNVTTSDAGKKDSLIAQSRALCVFRGQDCYVKAVTDTEQKGKIYRTDTEVWYSWGTLYTNVNDVLKAKMRISEAEINELIFGEDGTEKNRIANIPESWFRNIQYEAADDGYYLIKMELIGKKVEETVARLGLNEWYKSYRVSDAKIEFKVDSEGTPIDLSVAVDVKVVNMALLSFNTKNSGEGEFTNLGSAAKITEPEDKGSYRTFDDYKDYIDYIYEN